MPWRSRIKWRRQANFPDAIAIKDFGIKHALIRFEHKDEKVSPPSLSYRKTLATSLSSRRCLCTLNVLSLVSGFAVCKVYFDSGESWMPSARRRVPRWSNWQWLTVRCSDYLFIDLVVQTMNARVMVVECVGPKQIVLTVRTNDHAAFLSLMNRRLRWCMLLLPQADHNK